MAYSKLLGSLIGGLLGLGVSRYGLPAEWATPDFTAALTMVLSAVFTFAFPANRA